MRQRSFGEVDPVDRFLTAFGRCLYSCSEEKIISVLESSEVVYKEKRTFDGEKVFDRVQRAYFAMPEKIRHLMVEKIKALES